MSEQKKILNFVHEIFYAVSKSAGTFLLIGEMHEERALSFRPNSKLMRSRAD
jgi:hypothetical protein